MTRLIVSISWCARHVTAQAIRDALTATHIDTLEIEPHLHFS